MEEKHRLFAAFVNGSKNAAKSSLSYCEGVRANGLQERVHILSAIPGFVAKVSGGLSSAYGIFQHGGIR